MEGVKPLGGWLSYRELSVLMPGPTLILQDSRANNSRAWSLRDLQSQQRKQKQHHATEEAKSSIPPHVCQNSRWSSSPQDSRAGGKVLEMRSVLLSHFSSSFFIFYLLSIKSVLYNTFTEWSGHCCHLIPEHLHHLQGGGPPAISGQAPCLLPGPATTNLR